MAGRLFSVDLRRRAEQGLILAIGDVHGRLDLLEIAAEAIRAYPGSTNKFVVMQGDNIDRGSDSRGVLEFLSTRRAGRLAYLQGNHEQMLLSAELPARPSHPRCG